MDSVGQYVMLNSNLCVHQVDAVEEQQLHYECEMKCDFLTAELNMLKVLSDWKYMYMLSTHRHLLLAKLFKAEKVEMTRKLSESKSVLKDMGGENQELRQKLEELQQQNTCLGRLYSSVTGQLTQLNKCKGEVEAMKEHAEALKDAVVAKTVEAMDLKEEKESMQKMMDEIANELERRRIEVILHSCVNFALADNHLHFLLYRLRHIRRILREKEEIELKQRANMNQRKQQ